MSGRPGNLRPWKPGQSGNLGGRPRTMPLTDELVRLLEAEAPNADGKSWASVIAEALLKRARKGDARSLPVLANRIEGRPHQSLAVDLNAKIHGNCAGQFARLLWLADPQCCTHACMVRRPMPANLIVRMVARQRAG